ncbi:EAL domain-containing protein [Phormidium sp. LEGE 05292]|uniref:putative bifunctional diguanylate cyclase/phosphodiesterase n=1 Tax=[Phormidium] sp. LEGE 05292 TaxID=767427 RepID=UPI00188192BB|nr:EAL domain-containing response regulator [Phormidium sp. LEGE 05292]MBE9228808.1 EAL domain-containing protein [Phormidium sp. LEGE 05292]
MSNSYNALNTPKIKPQTKILVIEDDENIRENILDILRGENLRAIGAKNGVLGIRLAQKIIPDLIICDIMMPELDGYNVLEQLRQDPLTAVIPFIFLTALTDRDHNRKGMELGADDYITKPCKSVELLKAIAIRLSKKTAIIDAYTTALKQASQQLNKSLYYDSLTNLPNRLLLKEKFNQILNYLALNKRISTTVELLSIVYISLDRFNRIVEVLGYSQADNLLQAVAERLQTYSRNCHTIARLGTDEFAIIMVTDNQKKIVIEFVQNLLVTLGKPIILDNSNEVLITASIGISLYPADGSKLELEKMLQLAHKAMSYVKQQGGNSYAFYQPTLNLIDCDRLSLETSLSHALERNELEIYYQPKISLKTGEIVGAEALLRWFHPEQGNISPIKFIPIAEETKLIIPLGEWVLKTACQQTKLWQNSGYPELRIAVNISGLQFHQSNFYSQLVQILKETDFSAEYLELELTETVLMENVEIDNEKLTAFKELGVQIAIDDFGTGYSSLSYLQQFSFDILKIDKSFIRQLNKNTKTKTITSSIIQMGHELNLNLVAEGVETKTELDFLYQTSCDEIQGFLFSQPVNVKDFTNLLMSRKTLTLPQ